MQLEAFIEKHANESAIQKLNTLCKEINDRSTYIINAVYAKLTKDDNGFKFNENEIKERTECMNWLYTEIVYDIKDMPACTKEEFADILLEGD